MIDRIFIKVLLLCLLTGVTVISCKKDNFITSADAKISTSADSPTNPDSSFVKFDTVFTTVGSVTQSFKINNDNDRKLLISSIKLMGGASSSFKININGIAASEADNIEVAANDNIYVFVMVTVDPTTANLPFIISDSILISYNGNQKFVHLEAYGQNAHFLRGARISTNTTFLVDKPYIILDSLVVDNSRTLVLPQGCRIYSHANAPILIDGTLLANGHDNNPVIFRGDRMDPDYKDLPAGWPGIYFRSTSKNNKLTFTKIYNAYQALVVYDVSPNTNPKLTLSKCIVDNAYDAGILCIGSSVLAENSLISNCGTNLNLSYGGDYKLFNCTVASYGNFYIQHKYPVLNASDYAEDGGVIYTNDLTAQFVNCIFWGENGSVDNEINLGKKGTVFNVSFDNCLYKAVTDPSNATMTNNIKNIQPEFDSIDVNKKYYDFHITKSTTSPAIDNGATTTYKIDLDNKTRTGAFDIGCYEK
jgi:hypothetical protein